MPAWTRSLTGDYACLETFAYRRLSLFGNVRWQEIKPVLTRSLTGDYACLETFAGRRLSLFGNVR